MQKTFLLIASFFFWAPLVGQTEFKTYEKGLIYSKKTMDQLKHIVDSLNLKYKVCDFNKVFQSKAQTVAHSVSLDSANILEAKEDMDRGISFEDFVAKYPTAKVRKNMLVVKHKYKNYKNKEIIEFGEVNLGRDYTLEIVKENLNDLYRAPVKNSWLYTYDEKTKYSSESIVGFYFPEDFSSIPLASKYNKQIGYSECLIDTVGTKFKDEMKPGWVELPKNWERLSKKKKTKLLEEMRSTQVVGGCSQDSRPREHAVNIALLSAETTNWEVFLKSHLDIMNDRFERVSDGSYAYGRRNTYIKELEELNINTVDLLIGISLRLENPTPNHYYGSIQRLGRAIAESESKEDFKAQMLSMIEDQELDSYNRSVAYFLFLNYNHYLENKNEKNDNTIQFEKAVASLPNYLKDTIRLEE